MPDANVIAQNTTDTPTRSSATASLWLLRGLLVVCVALLIGLLAQRELVAEPASTGAMPAAAQTEPHADEAEADGSAVFMRLYGHVLPHKLTSIKFGAAELPFYDTTIFQILAALLVFLVFFHVRVSLERARDGARMGWTARMFSGFVLFIRDEMVMPILGEKDGRAFLPYFLFLFFFIAFMNLLGLIPMGRTATACIFVTGALALTTLVFMIGGGMKEQGAAAFWKNLIPHGMPGWLVPLMFVVELIGLMVKPFALMIRLFANMMAGHLVVLSFMGLIFYFAKDLGNVAYGVAVPAVALGVFIMIIEAFVALLQAYIFTYLSILFVGMCRHPDH